MKAVLLLSSGIDSATALAKYTKLNYDLVCITFDYGQKNRFELTYAKKLAKLYKIKEHLIINISQELFNNSSSLNSNLAVETYDKYTELKNVIPNTYLPGRNFIFLSYAVSVAESRNISVIIFSANKNDKIDYPDCRKEFIKSFEKTINLGTHFKAKNNKGLTIKTPFIELDKSNIIKIGLDLGLDYRLTQTCYNPNSLLKPCLKCDACLLRIKSFQELNLIDPLLQNLDNTNPIKVESN